MINNNNNNNNNNMIFKQDNPVSVANTGIKGGPVIKIHTKMAIKIQRKRSLSDF